MEPRIQYAKTSDGVSIACLSAGDGPPLVAVPLPALSHVERGWDVLGHYMRPLAAAFHLVGYDSRGSGLSDRQAVDFSIDAMALDLEAAVEHTGLESFALMANMDGVPTAIRYAATHPESVTNLILVDGWTKFSDYSESAAYQMEASLREKDWVLFTEAFGAAMWRFEDPSFGRKYAEFMRACVEPEVFKAAQEAFEEYDVSSYLEMVTAPTLVIHNRENQWVPLTVAQRIAAIIPGAQLTLIDSLTYSAVPPLVQEFVGTSPTADAAERVGSKDTATILFTDVEGSTALTQRLGDAKARGLLREHERITRDALAAHGGSEVKTMGDGFMTSFGSATAALECAIAIQRAFADWNADANEPIKVRIGLNAGEPISEDDPDGRGDLFGTAVNMAARICAKAEGGQILAPIVVRELVAGKGFLLSDIGETELRGFEDPVRLYEVRWRGDD